MPTSITTSGGPGVIHIFLNRVLRISSTQPSKSLIDFKCVSFLTGTCAIHLVLVQTQHQPQRHSHHALRSTSKHYLPHQTTLYMPPPPTPQSHNRSTRWPSPQTRTPHQGSKRSPRVSFLLSPRRHRGEEMPVHVHTPPRSSHGRSSKPRGILRVR